MKKAKRASTVWLFVALVTLFTTLVSVPFCAILALKESYVLMTAFAVVIIHGCYGIGFYTLAYSRAKATFKCILAVQEGKKLYSDISRVTGYNEQAVKRCLLVAVKKGFITASIGEDGIEEINN